MQRYRNNCVSGKSLCNFQIFHVLEVCNKWSPLSIAVESHTSIYRVPYKDSNASTQDQQPQTLWE